MLEGELRVRSHAPGSWADRPCDHRDKDIFASHIHCNVAGENGPVGVTLFMDLDRVTVSGTLAEGTITAPDGGNACGWENLDDVIAAIETGGAYVNVHTDAKPSGEIRGQVR